MLARPLLLVLLLRGVLGVLGLVGLLGLAVGCKAAPEVAEAELRAKLALVGLEPLSEEEAGVPPGERGRYLPCRVLPGVDRAALPAHPAGYLLVRVGKGRETRASGAESAAAIRRELCRWREGESLTVTVRRNPYLGPPDEWWEGEVRLLMPPR